MLAKKIQSVQHDIVQHAYRLRTKASYRRSCATALVIGDKIVTELLPHVRARTIFSQSNEEFDADAVYQITPHIMKRIAGYESAQLAGEFPVPPPTTLQGTFFLALDAVQDPGNIGAIFRTALALRVSGIYLLPGCCDIFNDKAISAGRGAQFVLPFQNLTASEFPESTYYIADASGAPLSTIHPTAPCTIILGNEGHGCNISPPNHKKIAIPIATESLNVAQAAAIITYDFQEKLCQTSTIT